MFQGIPIDKTGDTHYDWAKAFIKSRGIDENAAEQITLCVLDADGKVLYMDTLLEIMEPGTNTTLPQFRFNKAEFYE